MVVLLLGGCGSKIDPMDRVLTELSDLHGTWATGSFPHLHLAANATTDQVVSSVFQSTPLDLGPVTEHRILEVRHLVLRGDRSGVYTAALVDTDFGVKIVLMKYAGPTVGWWSHVYDA
ncbi:MAG: hypothetical protein JWM99_968 [Verrucomicrobiales bacterium]|jgi:hypothetical protein|nr:hypothetical protein [Verrucomicrobiales bacterium]